jgi:pimeloyl-ACP methyl ester carboxylesterase
MGDRRQWLNSEVGVETHVTDVAELIWFEDLHEVTLVLHSYSGLLGGPIALRVADRLAHVIFLGAFVASPGQCLLDVEPPEVGDHYRQLAQSEGEGWLIRASPAFLDQWGVPSELHDFVGPRLTDFPLRCQTDPVLYDPSELERLPCTYVWHSDPPLASLDKSRATARRWGWDVQTLQAGHDMMLAAPGATASLIERISQS